MWTSIFLRVTGVTVFIVTVALGYFYSQSATNALQIASPGTYVDPGPTRFVDWYLPSAFALMLCALLFGVASLVDRKAAT